MDDELNGSERQILYALLRQIRLDAGLRQVDVAERLGAPQSFVSKYESGERRLDLLELRKVCTALGISLSEFVRLFEGAEGEG
jgi:transcriptional regulator with XRE-family HTH domain